MFISVSLIQGCLVSARRQTDLGARQCLWVRHTLWPPAWTVTLSW